MIREINTSEITKVVKEMCIEANHFLSKDMDEVLKKATKEEMQAMDELLGKRGKKQ